MAIKTNIQQLNADFGIAKHIEFIGGKGNLPCIRINNENATALISIYAGQVLSFKPAHEQSDLLFVSDNAYFQAGKAIKGGIPICWPWFGAAPGHDFQGPLKKPNHGFVRNNFWSVLSTSELKNGDSKITLEITDSKKTRAIWPYHFHLTLEIVVGDSLSLELITRNTSNQVFSITEALHAYFNIGDATQARILGLEHTEFFDKIHDFVSVCQVGTIKIAEPTDHIHSDDRHEMIIEDPAMGRSTKISSSGNKNVVVWNPWAQGSAAMTDLGNDDYKHFICLEISNAANNSIEIPPNSEYRIDAHYSIV